MPIVSSLLVIYILKTQDRASVSKPLKLKSAGVNPHSYLKSCLSPDVSFFYCFFFNKIFIMYDLAQVLESIQEVFTNMNMNVNINNKE